MPSKGFTILLCLVLAVVPAGVCRAQGTSGSQFLGIGVGARPMAMGGAHVALADGGTALAWNPAGLAQVTGHTFSLTHVSWLANVDYNYAAYATPFGKKGAFGVALEQGSTSWDNDVPGEGTFEAGDFYGAVGYGRRLRPNLGLAASLRYVSSTLGDESSQSMTFDVGAIYRISENTSLAAAVRNMGGGGAYVSESDPLPVTLAMGGAYEWRDFLFALDFEKVNDIDLTTRFGVEYYPVRYLALRGGAILGANSALDSYAGGLGVNWDERWFLDYAYQPSTLGGTHQLALSAGFGTGPGLMVAAAADESGGLEEVAIPKSNIAVLTELLDEVVEEAVGSMSLPPGSEVYIAQVGQHEGSWLVESVLVEKLTKRGHTVMTGGMAAVEPAPGEPAMFEIKYRIVAGETTYARVWREWMVGARKVERRSDVDIHFQLSDTSRAIVWADDIQRQRREIIPGGRIEELSTPGQTFASPPVEEGGWDKILEPLIVAAIVGGLIYLFYTSRSSN